MFRIVDRKLNLIADNIKELLDAQVMANALGDVLVLRGEGKDASVISQHTPTDLLKNSVIDIVSRNGSIQYDTLYIGQLDDTYSQGKRHEPFFQVEVNDRRSDFSHFYDKLTDAAGKFVELYLEKKNESIRAKRRSKSVPEVPII